MNKVKVLSDVPLISSSYDALRFDQYSKKLAQIIMSSDPRFVVGIFGSWGTGKTSLMKMIEEKLDKKNALVMWFDAWRYDRDKHFALLPFLRQLRIKLENQPVKSNWRKIKKGVEHTLTALADSVEPTAGYSPYLSLKFSIRTFVNSLKVGSATINGENILLQEHPTDNLANAIGKLRNKNGNDRMRIVVFIDDLDRCTPEKALEVLESIKAFLDIRGIVYVIAMDSNSIDAIVRSKYGNSPTVSGLDYLQKIVQLPFQIPTWKDGWEDDEIAESIKNIIKTGLEDYELVDEIQINLHLIVSGVQLNPREVKRFINNVILAQSVILPPEDDSSLSIRNLIAVQALLFRNKWKDFLDIIKPDKDRRALLRHYKVFRESEKAGKIVVPTLENLIPERSEKGVEFFSQISKIHDELMNPKISTLGYETQVFLNDVEGFYVEYLKQGKELKRFLESGADDILLNIKKIATYTTALAATKDRKVDVTVTKDQLNLIYSSWRDAAKDKDHGGKEVYQFHAGIDAPNVILDQIRSVTYRLPPVWKDRAVQPFDDKHRSSHFKLKDLAWGPFTLFADVKFDGQYDLVTLSCPIILREKSPKLPF